ncbi:hypothetical protein DEO72_LG11g1382 [Vigna unguiculata]|uniref:Uncharacterized protein n=1 Tax=Vigna unguiculata TaxID=3917 RepID=A0A4D6NMZ2_VIGUN|nr:hypothetical protein DEO72_LG11g1382 [Vigna unguiculata]
MVHHLMDVIPWTLLGGVHGGVSLDGRNPMNLVERVQVGALCKDVISRRFRGDALRPGRNSMKASGGASCKDVIPRRPCGGASLLGRNPTKVSWWCLIICIRIV